MGLGMEEREARRLAALIRELPEDLREILVLLLRNPKGLWFNEIYRRLRKKIGSPTTLSKKLKDLIEVGLVEREGGPQRKSIYKLKPWFLQSFHELFVLGVPKLGPDEEASFLVELPAIFVSAKEVADRLEELLTGEFIGEEWAAEGQVKIERYRYSPEGRDIEVLAALLWLSRTIIDAIARVLILGSKDLDRERTFIMESVDRFLRTLSEHAGEVDRVKWGDVWHFLSEEWLRHYIALFNWLMPKVEGKEYPTPIITAQPERERAVVVPFSEIWRRILWLTRSVMHAQVLSIALSKESIGVYKRLHKELEKLRRECPELTETEEWIKHVMDIVERLRREIRPELERDSKE